MKKYIILLLLICLTGCSGAKTPQSSPAIGTCQVLITVEEGATTLLDTSLQIYAEDTVLTALQRAAKDAENIPVVLSGSGKSAYVTSIGGYTAGAMGDMSGWIYEKNNEAVLTAAGETPVLNGDKIQWKYITSFSE